MTLDPALMVQRHVAGPGSLALSHMLRCILTASLQRQLALGATV
jgi:hypothetical protein